MSKNIWLASIDTYEDVLATKVYFETREQAERFINLVQSNPEVLFPGIKINDCMQNKIICSVSPIPLKDDEYINEYERELKEKKE